MHISISGNTSGLKASELRRIDKLSNQRIRSAQIVTPEVARRLTELSREIGRQIGLLIDRRGHIRETVVGDARSLFLPDLSKYRQGRDRFCGLRLVHTHLHDAGLDDDDYTDLALLRLDAIAAIYAQEDGLPGPVYMGHVLPDSEADTPWEALPPVGVHDLPEDFPDMIAALEGEFAQKRSGWRTVGVQDRAILLHISSQPRAEMEDSLAELKELTTSAGIEVVHETLQRRPIDPKTVMGKGKLKTIIIKAMQLDAEVLIFDMNLTPTQVKNLADVTDLKILDRTQVILDIFAQRAETREGKIQVELAQLRYMLPFLSTKHTAMSRLTGGIGGRGPGETKLEVNRRRAQDRISQLQREVNKLGDRRRLRRSKRTDKNVPMVSIVGYTNAGKSTLLNRLTRSDVTAQDALFATLNPVSRRLRLPREREIVITDTVGFIRKLPPELMAAFKTTFEEIEPASLLLHVLDASNPEIDELHDTVNQLLAELEYQDKPTLVVLNKIDLCDAETIERLTEQYHGIAVSALDADTLTPLLELIEDQLGTGPRQFVAPDSGDADVTAADSVEQDVV